MLNVILQALELDLAIPLSRSLSIVVGMQSFTKIYQKVQETGPVSLFSVFEPRQNLDNLIGYIFSISMCMQNFIAMFFTVQEIGPFSLFQNLELVKASTNKNVSSQSLGLVYQNIPFSSRDRAIFTFSEFGTRQSLDR